MRWCWWQGLQYQAFLVDVPKKLCEFPDSELDWMALLGMATRAAGIRAGQLQQALSAIIPKWATRGLVVQPGLGLGYPVDRDLVEPDMTILRRLEVHQPAIPRRSYHGSPLPLHLALALATGVAGNGDLRAAAADPQRGLLGEPGGGLFTCPVPPGVPAHGP